MSDQVVPKFLIPADGAKIHLGIAETDARNTSSGNIYNQPGATYNQPGGVYGGLYHPDSDVIPQILASLETRPSMQIEQTDAYNTAQGYTYNQPGFTYNQPGVLYGGMSLIRQDISPIITNARFDTPRIARIDDIGSTHPTPFVANQTLLPVGLPYYFLTYS